MKTIMEKAGIQILILTICASAAFPEFFLNRDFSERDTSGFVLVKQSYGIDLYEKWNSAAANGPAREIKAVLTIQTEMNAVTTLIKDEEKGLQWNKNSRAYKVLNDDPNWLCYIQYDLPWPVSDQDCVLRYTEHLSPDTLVIAFESVIHQRFPEQQNITRIHDIKGKWVLLKIPEGVRAEYYITTTPSKTLPRWVTDPIIRNNLINTMIEFRRILEKEKKKTNE